MSVDSVSKRPTADGAAASAGPVSKAIKPRHRHIPRRFFLGTFALYAIFLGTFLLNGSSLHRAVPRGETVVPLLAGFSFYLVSNLFLIILGRGNVSRWTVLKCSLSTLVLATALCLTLRASLVYPALDPDSAPAARALLKRVAEIVRTYILPPPGQHAYAKLVGMVIVEETIKLLPLMALIATRKIRTAHGAMLCGAFSGLVFGMVEGISFGYLEYPAQQSPITTYLTRFLVMGPQHAVWDALAGGIIFLIGTQRADDPQQRGRRPTAWACAAGFAWAVIFHVAHNALQAMLGPFTQIATVFGLMMPLYLLSKAARRRSAVEGVDYSKQVFGDLQMFTIAMGTLFLAGSVGFSRTAGRTARLLEDQWTMTEAIGHLQDAESAGVVDVVRAELLRSGLSSNDPELVKVRDKIVGAAATMTQLDRRLHFLGRGDHGGASCEWGRDGVPPLRDNDHGIACLMSYFLLNDCRLRLNGWATRRDLPPPYKPVERWRVAVRSVSLSAEAAVRCEREESGEHAAPDPYVILAQRSADKTESFDVAARSEVAAQDAVHADFSPPWSAEACLWERPAVLLLVDDDGDGARGEILDVLELLPSDFDGELKARDGSIISVTVSHESH